MTQRFHRVAAALAVATLFGLPILSSPYPATDTAPPVHASRLAGIAGAGLSGLQIQNMDAAQSATMVVDFYKQGGGAPVSIVRPNVGAGAAANVYLPSEASLQNGAYAGIISSDRSIRTVARADWSTSGGALMTNGALPSTELIVPFGMKGFEGQTALVSIQNTDTGALATVQVRFYTLANPSPLVTTTIMIAPGTSTTLDLSKSAAFATVPTGTAGYLRITSSTPVGALNFVDVETAQFGTFGHEGLPVEQASSRLFAPVVHAAAPRDPQDAASPALDTLMMVINPGAAAVNVDIRYSGVGGTCQGQSFTHPTFSLPAGGGALVAQAPGASYPGVAASPLPAGCNAAAVIEATGGELLASVVDRQGMGTTAAAYNALAATEGGTRTSLPLARRNHTGSRMTTAVQVMNLSSSPATATLAWRDAMGIPVTGCGADCTAAIPPGGAYLFWPPSIGAIPDATYGSAEVTSDQAVGVVVTDISLAGSSDMSSYAGLAETAGGGPGPVAAEDYVPLLFKSMSIPMDTATPRSTATPMATPTAMATPTVMPTSTALPPPTDTPMPTATSAGIAVSDAVRSKVPPAVVSAALANPARVAGWRQPRDPGKPVSPANPLRECLTLVDPGKPYHPLFNSLVFKAGCP